MLEHAFLYISREDVEALQISHRYFHGIISAEGFGKVTPLLRLKWVQLRDDRITICRNGTAKRFGYDSEDVVAWLRITCVDTLDMTAFFIQTHWSAERALRWIIDHRSMFLVVKIIVKLPSDDALQEAFLRPDTSHHWTCVTIGGDIRGNLRLTSSSLEYVKHFTLIEPPGNMYGSHG